MSIHTQKLPDGLTEIVWKTVASKSSKNDWTCVSSWFKLDRVHFDAVNAVQLRLGQFEGNNLRNSQESVRVNFTLKLVTRGSNRIDDEVLSSDFEYQPCSALPKIVWVSINGGNIQAAINKKEEKWCTWQSVNIVCLFLFVA